jgi:hypothetical protein
MICRIEAIPEQTVRRYFLQVPALLNLRFPGSRMPVGSTGGIRILLNLVSYVCMLFISTVDQPIERVTNLIYCESQRKVGSARCAMRARCVRAALLPKFRYCRLDPN